METKTSIAIVGAGPYGLAIAAHLRDRGVPYRIFGSPMEMWRSNCPRGMFLKSDGFACDLYDPARLFTLKPDLSPVAELRKWNTAPRDLDHLLDGLRRAGWRD